MRVKRFFAAVLTAALLASLTLLPAGAAVSSFSDIGDQTTAVNADILRLMGVVSGTGSNRFDPNGTLTRAQFCTMVVNFLQKGSEAKRYATQTIFSDVKSTHWARAYINYAASYTVETGGEGSAGVRLISGVGDGRFLPDRNITMGEAATILLRALGYSGKDAGAVWPQGYMDLAESIGLTKNLSAGAYDSVSRAQAAQLFVNALKCKKQDGTVYYKSLGGEVESGAIILAVNVETDDGRSAGAIRTTSNKNSEAYLPAQGSGNPAALQGKRGDLVLNDKEEIITFVPDDSTAITITLSSDAQAAYVKANGGKQYTVSADALVYTGTGGEGRSWLDAYSSLTAGTQITMYSEKGKITAVYSASTATTIDTDAVVVLDHATAATFRGLTGGVTGYKIMKDRQPIYMNQIKPYDVVTYDQLSNTLVVSDLRMTAVYTDPQPNPKAPTELTAAGVKFDVLRSAWNTLSNIKPGDSVSLLLTCDGKVAGIVPATSQTRSTAVGTIDGGSVTIFLPNGSTMALGKASNASSVENGQLVIVSALRDSFSVSRLPEKHAPGDLDLNKLKLGSLTVSPGVRIYEQTLGSNVTAISRGDLTMDTIPTANISSYHVNSANVVDYIVLTNVTGSAYIYGMMIGGYQTAGDGSSSERYVWYLRSGTQDIEFTPVTTYRGSSGDMVGVVVGKDREGRNTIREIKTLTRVSGAKLSDFFDSQGEPYVTVAGQTYHIASNVECYYNRTGNQASRDNWLTGSSRLDYIKTYSDSFTLYVDTVGKQVRVIVAN